MIFDNFHNKKKIIKKFKRNYPVNKHTEEEDNLSND